MSSIAAGRAGVFFALVIAVLVGVGCSSKPEILPQEEFWYNLTDMCGKAYPGRVVIDSTNSPTFRDKPMTLQVSECSDDLVRMPLLIEGRRWATLEVSRVDGQLSLEHVHDQTSGQLPTGYGGLTRAGGTPVSQDFYADEFTGSLEDGAEDTVWTLEIRPGAVLSYALRREGTNRGFRMVFDLSRGRPAPTVLPSR